MDSDLSSREQQEVHEHSVELPLGTDEALAELARAAEAWGAEWRRKGSEGRLVLPVTAGLRHGRLSGRISTESVGDDSGTRLRLQVENSRYHLHWQAVVILLFGALGAVSFTLWPFYPPLLELAPMALVLAFAAWFLVASRLRTAGVQEFFELLAREER